MTSPTTIFLIVTLALCQLIEGNNVQIVTRQQWHARPPTNTPSTLKFPISRVIIAHTVTNECTDTEECLKTVRNIQNYHIDVQKFGDIGYNFLIGGDGLVYEGLGWGLQGAHTKGYNKGSIGIAFIGNFDKKRPTRKQLQNVQLFLELGISANTLNPNYKLYGHRQLISTKSPGDELYGIIRKWPHWSPLI